jgi:hypothetical protein
MIDIILQSCFAVFLMKDMPMLQLRPNCECCDRDLPPDAIDARICSFECTFCAACAASVLHGVCPNCSGNLVPCPIRPAARLLEHPASTIRHQRSAA